MNASAWISLAGILVSFISVFVSNWLGRKAAVAEMGNNQRLKRYQEYYIPFIKQIYNVKPYYWSFYDFRNNTALDGSNSYSELSDLMFNKMEYMGPDLPPLVTHLEIIAEDVYSDVNLALYSGFQNAPSLEQAAEKVEIANDLFDRIVMKTLQEASQLADSLSLEPIAEPLLSSYKNERDHRTQFLLRLQRAKESGEPLEQTI